jgi:hypothetical protein
MSYLDPVAKFILGVTNKRFYDIYRSLQLPLPPLWLGLSYHYCLGHLLEVCVVKDALSPSSITCVTGSTACVNGSPTLIGKASSDLGEEDVSMSVDPYLEWVHGLE